MTNPSPVPGYRMERHVLANGLQVCVQPEPTAPAVAVNLWYEVGSYDEEPGRTGFAHLFEHLMFQGSADVASGEHMATIESVGGSVNATTSTDRTNYFETVPAGALELALWLEANRMGSLDISEENFEAQREVVKEEKRQRYDNQPYGDVLNLLLAQHFAPEHPYGHLTIGEMADLDAATLDDVQHFFDAWYRPSNARLVICGNVDVEEALGMVETHFGSLPDLPAPGHASAPGPLGGRRTTVTERAVPHSLLYCSWLTPPAADQDHVALELALTILTEGHTSRLHRALVRDRGLAEEIHGGTLPHLRSSSLTTLLARPTAGVACDEVSTAIRGQLEVFCTDGPTEEELARARANYEREWLLGLATVEGRADTLNDSWLTFGDPEDINQRLEQVAALTPTGIRDVVEAHLASDPSEIHYLAMEA